MEMDLQVKELLMQLQRSLDNIMKNEEFDLLDDLSEHANSPKKTKYTPNSLAQKASSKHRTIKSCIHKKQSTSVLTSPRNVTLKNLVVQKDLR